MRRLAENMSLSWGGLLALAVASLFATTVSADTLDIGVPVKGFADPTVVGTEGWNDFFIPLSDAASGTFGVDAGPFPDVSDDVGGFLDVFILFDMFDFPPLTASLIFKFKDLDLEEDNTPSSLLETVQFSTSGGTFSQVIDNEFDVPGGGELDFTIAGDNDFRMITFPDVTGLITSNSLTVQMHFTATMPPGATNTKEKFKAKLYTSPIPEPSTVALLGLGLVGLVVGKRWRRRRDS